MTTVNSEKDMRERVLVTLIDVVPGIPATVSDETPLAQFGLNSMKQVDLMFGLEDEFDIQIDEKDLSEDAFLTVGSTLFLVARLQSV